MSFADLSKKDIEGPYKLPEGWRWVRLGDVVEPIMGQSPPSSTYNQEGIGLPFYQGKIDFGELYPTPRVWCNKPKKIAEPNDILISVRAPVGPVNICKEKSCIGRGLAALRPSNNDTIFYLFLFYYLKSVEKNWTDAGKGSTFQAIRKRDLQGLPISLPPLPEQKRIVARIEELFSKIDEIRRLKRQALEQAKALMSAALHEVFSKADEKEWKWVRLGNEVETDGKKYKLIAIESGKRPKGGSVEQGIPSLGGEQLLSNGRVNWNKLRFIPEDFYESMQKGKVKQGDVLVVKDGATTGKTVYVDHLPYRKIAVNEHVFLLRSKTEVLENKYLFYMLFSDVGQDQIKRLFHGATQGGITQNDVKSIQVPLPPLPEQKRIVVYLDRIQEKAQVLQKLQEEIEKEIEKLRESILHKAFKGEL